MSKELVVKEENFDLLGDIEQTQEAVKKLLQTKHFQQLGEPGIFAVVQKAKSLKINAFDALLGSLYYLNGKVGMSAEMMNTLIRSNGHSIVKDTKSNDNVCILHGKRCDNGDTWTESFSIDDAKRAGIYKNVWEKYPRNMCFNRALSNLARQLFPDVIKGCYEIEELKSINDTPQTPFNYQRTVETVEVKEETAITPEGIQNFFKNFNGDEELTREYVHMCMARKNISLSECIEMLSKDIDASHKAYAKWAAKQTKIETVEAVVMTTTKEDSAQVLMFNEEGS